MAAAFRPEFRVPLVVIALLIGGAFMPLLWEAATLIGIVKILWDSVGKLRDGNYSLDYIAFLAMMVSLATDQHLAGGIVALMITGGEALDEYASRKAESALRALAEKIPKSCIVRLPDGSTREKAIQDVQSGEIILVKTNELVPLDGTLRSAEAELNEANLTGEALPTIQTRGAFIKSGNVNVGPMLELRVEGAFETSTYMQIVKLVAEAKKYQPRVVRLAERVNFPFTALALVLALGAYLISGELARALAVLVIATPCPLIIAAPVAFIGGLSRAARQGIIVKRPATLEVLDRVGIVFFDKTGTLTLGEPLLAKIEMVDAAHAEDDALAIAAGIEFHSIHPLARAVVAARALRKTPIMEARNVVETIGAGIAGDVAGKRFTVSKASGVSHDGITLSLKEGEREIARLHFEDRIKDSVSDLFRFFAQRGIRMEILTGDHKENAERLLGHFGIPIRASISPEGKFAAIDEAKRQGLTVAMVGDGLNDAPALAHADVGIVFSGTENSAAIEAANAVILGRDVMLLGKLFDTAKKSVRVASESIWGGVALSSIGMVFAALGYIPPIAGALVQEVIDVTVILNSLRSSRS